MGNSKHSRKKEGKTKVWILTFNNRQKCSGILFCTSVITVQWAIVLKFYFHVVSSASSVMLVCLNAALNIENLLCTVVTF